MFSAPQLADGEKCPYCTASGPLRKGAHPTRHGSIAHLSVKTPMMNNSFYVSVALHDRMTETAQECGTTVGALCRAAVEDFLNRLEADYAEI